MEFDRSDAAHSIEHLGDGIVLARVPRPFLVLLESYKIRVPRSCARFAGAGLDKIVDQPRLSFFWRPLFSFQESGALAR